MLDGKLARTIKGGATDFGADLDAITDLIMVAAGIAFIVPAMDIWPALFPLIIGALTLKFTTGITTYFKHGKVFYTHTLLGKFIILMLFIGANIYFILHTVNVAAAGTILSWYLAVCIVIVALHCFEEHLIVAKIDYPEKNTKTIFHVKGLNEKYRAEQSEK